MPDHVPKNTIEFKVSGRYALFTDPLTRVGGEKCSYRVPTCEALKGVAKSIYWKPSLVWVIDEARVVKKIQTQTKGIKPLKWGGGNDLSIYTYLVDVEYQVRAHFTFNQHRPELRSDWTDGKHFAIVRRVLQRGGRQDVFLGTRECQGYVEPCVFGEGAGAFDATGSVPLGVMFHSFDYPDESGEQALYANFWQAEMQNGVIRFKTGRAQGMRKFVRGMSAKVFTLDRNQRGADAELDELGAAHELDAAAI